MGQPMWLIWENIWLSLILIWKQRQKYGKLTIIGQFLTFLSQLLQRFFFAFPGLVAAEVVGQGVICGQAMVHFHVQSFTKENIWMNNKHMEMYWTLFVIREMQVKVTMRYHYLMTRMAKIKKMADTKFWWEYGATGTLTHCWWTQWLWKTVWQFSQEFSIHLASTLAISLKGSR